MNLRITWIVQSVRGGAPLTAVKPILRFLRVSIAVSLVGVSSMLALWAMSFATVHSTARRRQAEASFAAHPLAHVHKFVVMTSPNVIQSQFRSYFFAPSQVVVGSTRTKSTI